jgi:hypothetical protein
MIDEQRYQDTMPAWHRRLEWRRTNLLSTTEEVAECERGIAHYEWRRDNVGYTGQAKVDRS